MMSMFRKRIRSALSNPTLQSALDRNAERRQEARSAALASLPEADAVRQRARAIREQTLANLHHYLDQFQRQLERNGVQTHLAASAEDACRIVVDLAQANGARLIAKSKSMVTEEVRLNPALERAGIRVVETDLGEFIAQLRGEPPSHIITPVVHLRREEVAATFADKLGMAYTTDVAAMTATARQILRELFLEAQMGISGVNFGVAETGTLCVVTNEGNGRMVTTAPRVHVALMGIERLVPTLDDLAVMLQLLPRSATGQKLTSYVSLIQGPIRATDLDGPSERHLILIDNGRTAAAEQPLAEILYCIRCGACLNACPVFREIGGHAYGSVYSGPIGAVVSPALFGVTGFGHLSKASTLCGACQEACPVGIDFPKLLLRVRGDSGGARRRRWLWRVGMIAYSWIATSPRRYRAALKAAGFACRLLPRRKGWIHALPPPVHAWTASRHFPPFAGRPLQARLKPPLQARQPSRRSLPRMHTIPLHVSARATEERPVERFARELAAVGGEWVLCAPGELPERLTGWLFDLGIRQAVVPAQASGILRDVVAHLDRQGLDLIRQSPPDEPEENRQAWLRNLARAEVGITQAMAGLADTGTLVLPSGAAQSQLASLLPPIHFAILPAQSIFASMADWLESEQRSLFKDAAAVALVSGPSRTADIEMTMTVGVHGPGKLVVFCAQGQEAIESS